MKRLQLLLLYLFISFGSQCGPFRPLLRDSQIEFSFSNKFNIFFEAEKLKSSRSFNSPILSLLQMKGDDYLLDLYTAFRFEGGYPPSVQNKGLVRRISSYLSLLYFGENKKASLSLYGLGEDNSFLRFANDTKAIGGEEDERTDEDHMDWGGGLSISRKVIENSNFIFHPQLLFEVRKGDYLAKSRNSLINNFIPGFGIAFPIYAKGDYLGFSHLIDLNFKVKKLLQRAVYMREEEINYKNYGFNLRAEGQYVLSYEGKFFKWENSLKSLFTGEIFKHANRDKENSIPFALTSSLESSLIFPYSLENFMLEFKISGGAKLYQEMVRKDKNYRNFYVTIGADFKIPF